MARWLTPLHAVLVAALLGLGLGVALTDRHPREFGARFPTRPETRARHAIERHASAVADAWHDAAMIDSLRRAIPPGPEGTWSVVVGRGVPAWAAEATRQAAADGWAGVTRGPGAPATTIAIIVDTDSTSAGLPRGGWRWRRVTVLNAVPDEGGGPCLMVIRLGPTSLTPGSRPTNFALDLRHDVPGVCGFVTAFGIPGPHVGDWLFDTQARFARDASWQAGSSPAYASDNTNFSIRTLWWDLETTWGRALVSCMARNARGCEGFLLTGSLERWLPMASQAPLAARRQTSGLTVGTIVGINDRGFYYTRHPWYAQFASDLVAGLGADAFRTFWTSALPMDEAFTAAYGQSLGTWAVRWERDLGVPVPREMRSPWAVVPVSLLVMLVALGGGLAYASRRTVAA